MASICKILACILFSVWLCAVSLIVFWAWECCSPFCIHHPGVVLVALGVIGETLWEEHKKLKRYFAWMLIAGLLLEMREAVNEDGKVEALRSANNALEAKLQPRIIRAKQIKDFIFLTEKIPKIPIRICVHNTAGEAFSYAYQIRQMLNRAGYEFTNSNASTGVGLEEITPIRFVGKTEAFPFIYLLMPSTNGVFVYSKVPSELATNGYYRPVVTATDPEHIYGAIMFVFNQLGITTDRIGASRDVQPGEYGFFVVGKNN